MDIFNEQFSMPHIVFMYSTVDINKQRMLFIYASSSESQVTETLGLTPTQRTFKRNEQGARCASAYLQRFR